MDVRRWLSHRCRRRLCSKALERVVMTRPISLRRYLLVYALSYAVVCSILGSILAIYGRMM